MIEAICSSVFVPMVLGALGAAFVVFLERVCFAPRMPEVLTYHTGNPSACKSCCDTGICPCVECVRRFYHIDQNGRTLETYESVNGPCNHCERGKDVLLGRD